LAIVALATALLCLPFIQTIYYLGDEGILLNGAKRMLAGGHLYVDFFEFLPPGGFVLTAAWFSLAGTSIWSARLLIILTIVGIAIFTFLACRNSSKNALISAFLTTWWIVMSQGGRTQVSHHWFTTLFSMMTIWAALASTGNSLDWLRWPATAGAAAGMAAMVTPTRGALVILAALTAFLNLRQRTGLIAYVLGCALAPAGLLAYVIWDRAFSAAYDDIIGFMSERYAPIQFVPWGTFANPQNFPLTFLFPVAALLALIVAALDWRGFLRDRLLRQCAAFGLAGFVGCFPRPDIVHIAFAVPLVCPLLACCLSRLGQMLRPAFRYLLIGVAIWLLASSALAFWWIWLKAPQGEPATTAGGRVLLVGLPEVKPLLARIAATPAEDTYFFYPYMPMLPFLSGRQQVSKFEVFVPGYTSPSQYQDACKSVMQRASWVVIDHQRTDLKTLKLFFPAMKDAQPEETRRFERALDTAFAFVSLDGSLELRRRVDGINDNLCDDMAK
jgi:hypothetical protein